MPVKYECSKCGRRFTEWGAEKVGFKCPKDQWSPADHPDDLELVRVGTSDEGFSRRPTLKRAPRKLAPKKTPKVQLNEDEALVPDIDEMGADDESDASDDDLIIVEDDESDDVGIMVKDDADSNGDKKKKKKKKD